MTNLWTPEETGVQRPVSFSLDPPRILVDQIFDCGLAVRPPYTGVPQEITDADRRATRKFALILISGILLGIALVSGVLQVLLNLREIGGWVRALF